MKKLLARTPLLLFLILILSGCNAIGDKSASLSIIYEVAAILSLCLLIICCRLVHKYKVWFVLLFFSVLIINIGYTFLSLSTNLTMALWANRISYLGSVFLPLSMLMIILNLTNTNYKRWQCNILFSLAIIMFLIAASPGILPIYYKKVAFVITNDSSILVKEYGRLHSLYFIYLIGYFTSMVVVIIRAQIKKTIETTAHAVIVAIAVFINIGVWFIEQLTTIDFEMLSISYIISEIFLLCVHLVMNKYQRMCSIVKQIESAQTLSDPNIKLDSMLETPIESTIITSEQIEAFIQGLHKLTPTEHSIYDAHIARVTSKEIMASMNIKESTLKYHNRNLYGKLGVTTRKELLEVHKHIKSMKVSLKETHNF